MIVIVCIDDDGGLMFNNRRQSRDKIVTQKILEISKHTHLWMSKYSQDLFNEYDANNINTVDDFLSEAPKEDYCFVEGQPLSKYEPYIEKIIVFKWNRKYPSDIQLDIDISKNRKLIEQIEFKGNSHDKITMEVYA